MEHLPWLGRHHQCQPRTPYLCDDLEISFAPSENLFGTFLDIQDDRFIVDPSFSIIERARKCQSELFFRLVYALSRASGLSFKVQDYVDQSDLKFLNTSKVKHCMVQITSHSVFYYESPIIRNGSCGWNSCLCFTCPDGDRFYVDIETLTRWSDWITEMTQQLEEERPDDNSCNEIFNVFWSTLMLIDLITETAAVPKLKSVTRCFAYRSKYLTHMFQQFGQCPAILRRLRPSSLDTYKLLSVTTMHEVRHDQCCGLGCNAYNIDSSSYQMKHAKSCTDPQKCSTLHVNSERLDDLLRSGASPIIRSLMSNSGQLTVEITSDADIERATAISHVWAGGLGNFSDNAHYRCQLRDIHQSLQVSGSTIMTSTTTVAHYWFDTLCVPLQNNRASRNRAVEDMACAYAKCKSVLIIDPQLSSICCDQLSEENILIMVIASPWMTRSWTLLEQCLATNVQVKFADRLLLLDMSKVHAWLCRYIETTPNLSWNIQLFHSDSNLGWRGFWNKLNAEQPQYTKPSIPDFVTIWNDLKTRNSTVPEDVTAILAHLIGYSAGETLAIESARRMHAILQTQTQLPVSLLFVSTDEDMPSTWTPSPPVCDADMNLLSWDLGCMDMLPTGHIKISELRRFSYQPHVREYIENVAGNLDLPKYLTGVKVLRCRAKLPATNKLYLRDNDLSLPRADEKGRIIPLELASSEFLLRGRCTVVGIACLEVGISERRTASFPQHKMDLLFLLSRTHLATEDKATRIGLWFEVKTGVDMERGAGISARYVGRCTWKATVRPIHSTYHQEAEQMASDWMGEVSDGELDFKTQDLSLSITEGNPLLLDMGISSASILHKSRPDFYPITKNMRHISGIGSLFLFQPILTLLYFLVYTYCILMFGILGSQNDVMQEVVGRLVGVALMISMASLRCLHANLEYQWMRQATDRGLKMIWASSFCTESKTPTFRISSSSYTLIVAIVVYGLIFVSSALGTILILYKYGRERDVYCYGETCLNWIDIPLRFIGPRRENYLMAIVKPVIAAVFFELIFRIFILLLFRPWNRINNFTTNVPLRDRDGGSYPEASDHPEPDPHDQYAGAWILIVAFLCGIYVLTVFFIVVFMSIDLWNENVRKGRTGYLFALVIGCSASLVAILIVFDRLVVAVFHFIYLLAPGPNTKRRYEASEKALVRLTHSGLALLKRVLRFRSDR